MDRKHLIAALILGTGMLMAFTIGCTIVGTPAAQHAPISAMFLGFLTVLAGQIWSKADSDAKLGRIERKADVAAEKADSAAAMSALAADKAAEAAKAGGP